MLSLRPVTGAAGPGFDFRRAALALVRLRTERDRFFAPLSVGGPAWALMLVLFASPSEADGPCLGEVADRARVPRTTALRWLRKLSGHGYVTLATDRDDKRAVRVQLTDAGQRAMAASFAAAADLPGPVKRTSMRIVY